MLCSFLRFFLHHKGPEGTIGGTPTFLYLMQFVTNIIFSVLLVLGEMKKSENLLNTFPLLKSRSGRGVIMLMIGLPLGNWNQWFVALCAFLTILWSCFMIFLGSGDPPVDQGTATEGNSTQGAKKSVKDHETRPSEMGMNNNMDHNTNANLQSPPTAPASSDNGSNENGGYAQVPPRQINMGDDFDNIELE